MKFSYLSIREMLQDIIEMKAPYSHDRIQMAVEGFKQHSEYAVEIVDRLEKGIGIDVKESILLKIKSEKEKWERWVEAFPTADRAITRNKIIDALETIEKEIKRWF